MPNAELKLEWEPYRLKLGGHTYFRGLGPLDVAEDEFRRGRGCTLGRSEAGRLAAMLEHYARTGRLPE